MNEKIVLRRLGKRIKKERLKRKLSQQELSLACGISVDYVSRIETGKANSTIKPLNKRAEKLNLRIANLFE